MCNKWTCVLFFTDNLKLAYQDDGLNATDFEIPKSMCLTCILFISWKLVVFCWLFSRSLGFEDDYDYFESAKEIFTCFDQNYICI